MNEDNYISKDCLTIFYLSFTLIYRLCLRTKKSSISGNGKKHFWLTCAIADEEETESEDHSASDDSEEEDSNQHLLDPQNGVVSFIKEKPVAE